MRGIAEVSTLVTNSKRVFKTSCEPTLPESKQADLSADLL